MIEDSKIELTFVQPVIASDRSVRKKRIIDTQSLSHLQHSHETQSELRGRINKVEDEWEIGLTIDDDEETTCSNEREIKSFLKRMEQQSTSEILEEIGAVKEKRGKPVRKYHPLGKEGDQACKTATSKASSPKDYSLITFKSLRNLFKRVQT